MTWTDTPSDNTRELQLKGGQAQVDEFPAWSTVASLKTTPNVTMNLFNSTRTDYLAFNETVKPFQDVHVRRAISLAIDRAALVKAVLFGNGKPANSIFPPQVPYYQAATQGLQFDLTAGEGGDGQVERAEGLLHHDPGALGLLRRRDHRHDRAVRAQAAWHQPEDPAARPEHGVH